MLKYLPLETPLVPLMYDSDALMLWTAKPIPPALFEINAHCFNVLYIPSIESSYIVKRKHELIYG